ncbi:MAG: aerotolerance regulator BatC [Flavobacteriaceae bacterium]|nr:aerotolerance regulator BatC [Flavobacteriaceae bacterium]|tara:strand:- start:4479 stop:5261 length:783 start_codon:yes stop_codon:yes gene_type:complete
MLFPFIVLGQEAPLVKSADNYIYDGNQAFDASNNVEAEKNYRRAAATGLKKDIAQYNMGTTLQQDNYVAEALSLYADAVEITKERPNKHRNFHNIGNALMQIKEYKGAVEAYKNALRNNPKDDETRYNYALAKKMLEDDDQNGDQDNNDKKDNKDNKDQDQDKKEDKGKDQEGDKEQDQKEGSDDEGENEKDNKKDDPKDQDQKEDKDKDQQQPQGNPTQLSPQQVKNLLEAMSNEEKKVQDKVNAQKVKPAGVKSKKDW